MVASPEPKRIVESTAIKALIQQGFVVIGAGGGGIPVVRTEAGDYQSVDAVIDKDLSTALLAREIHADILVITTGVEKVCIQFGKPQQQALNNRLARHGEKKAVTVVTQVEVDKNDPGFAHPTKPIGAFFSDSQRDELQKAQRSLYRSTGSRNSRRHSGDHHWR